MLTFSSPFREKLGRKVRQIWVVFASKQPEPKPHHLEPWEKLDEPNKEVDRQIGEELFKMGADSVDLVCQKCEQPLHRVAQGLDKRETLLYAVEPCHCQTSEIARLKSREQFVARLQMQLQGGNVQDFEKAVKEVEQEAMKWEDPSAGEPREWNWKAIAIIAAIAIAGLVFLGLVVIAVAAYFWLRSH